MQNGNHTDIRQDHTEGHSFEIEAVFGMEIFSIFQNIQRFHAYHAI